MCLEMDFFSSSLDLNCVSEPIPVLADVLLVWYCTYCICAYFSFCLIVPDFVLTFFNVHILAFQGRCSFEVFPLHQMSKKEGENGCENERETKRRTERDVICLQSTACTSDHSWEPTIICSSLPASFHFPPLILIPFLCIFLF